MLCDLMMSKHKRRKLLVYLRRTDFTRYHELLTELQIKPVPEHIDLLKIDLEMRTPLPCALLYDLESLKSETHQLRNLPTS